MNRMGIDKRYAHDLARKSYFTFEFHLTIPAGVQASRNRQVSMSGGQGTDEVGAARSTVRSLTKNRCSLTCGSHRGGWRVARGG